MRKIVSAILAVVALTTVTYAQQQRAATQEQMGNSQKRPLEDGRHRRTGRHRGFVGMRELDLTEEQRQQQRTIMQLQLANTKSQREELFKLREKRVAGTLTSEDKARALSLRRELRDSMHSIRTEMVGVLTPEQRSKLEQRKTERKAHRDEKREHRHERREQRDPTPR